MNNDCILLPNSVLKVVLFGWVSVTPFYEFTRTAKIKSVINTLTKGLSSNICEASFIVSHPRLVLLSRLMLSWICVNFSLWLTHWVIGDRYVSNQNSEYIVAWCKSISPTQHWRHRCGTWRWQVSWQTLECAIGCEEHVYFSGVLLARGTWQSKWTACPCFYISTSRWSVFTDINKPGEQSFRQVARALRLTRKLTYISVNWVSMVLICTWPATSALFQLTRDSLWDTCVTLVTEYKTRYTWRIDKHSAPSNIAWVNWCSVCLKRYNHSVNKRDDIG